MKEKKKKKKNTNKIKPYYILIASTVVFAIMIIVPFTKEKTIKLPAVIKTTKIHISAEASGIVQSTFPAYRQAQICRAYGNEAHPDPIQSTQ